MNKTKPNPQKKLRSKSKRSPGQILNLAVSTTKEGARSSALNAKSFGHVDCAMMMSNITRRWIFDVLDLTRKRIISSTGRR